MDKKYIERPQKVDRKEYNRSYARNNFRSLSVKVKDYKTFYEIAMNNNLSNKELFEKTMNYLLDNNLFDEILQSD